MSIPDDTVYNLGVFGGWDAPITDGVPPIPVPTELTCMFCEEHFREGDAGMVMVTGYAQHRECGFRSVMGGIGHHVDHAHWCGEMHDPDAGLTSRESALLVWKLLVDREDVVLP